MKQNGREAHSAGVGSKLNRQSFEMNLMLGKLGKLHSRGGSSAAKTIFAHFKQGKHLTHTQQTEPSQAHDKTYYACSALEGSRIIDIATFNGLFDSFIPLSDDYSKFLCFNPHNGNLYVLGLDGSISPSPLASDIATIGITKHADRILVLINKGTQIAAYDRQLNHLKTYDLLPTPVDGPAWLAPVKNGYYLVSKSSTVWAFDHDFKIINKFHIPFGCMYTRIVSINNIAYMIDHSLKDCSYVFSIDENQQVNTVFSGPLHTQSVFRYLNLLSIGDVCGIHYYNPNTNIIKTNHNTWSKYKKDELSICNGIISNKDSLYIFMRTNEIVSNSFKQTITVLQNKNQSSGVQHDH